MGSSNINRNNEVDICALIPVLNLLKNLKYVNLSNNRIEYNTVYKGKESPKLLCNIDELDFSNNQISNISFISFKLGINLRL